MKKKILIYSSSRADIDRGNDYKKNLKENIFELTFLSSFHKEKDQKKNCMKLENLKLNSLKIIKNKISDNYISTIEHFCYDLKRFNKVLLQLRPKWFLSDRFERFCLNFISSSRYNNNTFIWYSNRRCSR